MSFQDEEKAYRDLFRGKDILVYGAQNTAHMVVESLLRTGLGHVAGCAVTRMGGNPSKVAGIPVREIATYHLDKERTLVVIATMPIYFKEIQADLKRLGYLHVLTAEGGLLNTLFRLQTRAFLAERLQDERENGKE